MKRVVAFQQLPFEVQQKLANRPGAGSLLSELSSCLISINPALSHVILLLYAAKLRFKIRSFLHGYICSRITHNPVIIGRNRGHKDKLLAYTHSVIYFYSTTARHTSVMGHRAPGASSRFIHSHNLMLEEEETK